MASYNFSYDNLITYCYISYEIATLLFGGESFNDFSVTTNDPLFVGWFLNQAVIFALYLLWRFVSGLFMMTIRLINWAHRKDEKNGIKDYFEEVRPTTPSATLSLPPYPLYPTL